MRYRKIPQNLRQKVQEYYEHRYRRKFFNEAAILNELSKGLREVKAHKAWELHIHHCTIQVSILYPDNAVSVCLCVCVCVCPSRMWEVLWYKVYYYVGQSANSEWWVASWLQPWSQCDATKRHALKNCPVALVTQGIFP